MSKSERAVIRKSDEKGYGRGAIMRSTDLKGEVGQKLVRLIDDSAEDTGHVQVDGHWFMWHMLDNGPGAVPAVAGA